MTTKSILPYQSEPTGAILRGTAGGRKLAKPFDLEKTPFDVLDRRRCALIVALQESALALSGTFHDSILVAEVEAGLVEVLCLDEITDILYRDIDGGEIFHLLADYNFARLRPLKLDEILLQESMIPPDIPLFFVEEAEVKLKGEKWIVHKNDADPFPSNPHAHNYQQRLKMHLGNGDLYQGKQRVPCARMRGSDLIEFRARLIQKNATIALPPLTV